jgi:hypothetical protein
LLSTFRNVAIKMFRNSDKAVDGIAQAVLARGMSAAGKRPRWPLSGAHQKSFRGQRHARFCFVFDPGIPHVFPSPRQLPMVPASTLPVKFHGQANP